MAPLPEGLPDEVYDHIARLEIERYDARLAEIQTICFAMLGLGLIGIAFGTWGKIGALEYTGGPFIYLPSTILVVNSVVYYVRKDRQNRRSLDTRESQS